MHRTARRAPLGDPHRQQGRYSRWPVYGQTKLANLLFTFELDRRARRAELPVKALAAHPGFSGTHLAANGRYGRATGGRASILDAAVRAVAQPAPMGALPTLMATTADLPGSTYCGPSGWQESGACPRSSAAAGLAQDEDAQRRLWELSEDDRSPTLIPVPDPDQPAERGDVRRPVRGDRHLPQWPSSSEPSPVRTENTERPVRTSSALRYHALAPHQLCRFV